VFIEKKIKNPLFLPYSISKIKDKIKKNLSENAKNLPYTEVYGRK